MSDMKKPSREDITTMLVVIIIAMTCSFGIDIHLPSLPSIINYFHSTVGTGQLSVSLYVKHVIVQYAVPPVITFFSLLICSIKLLKSSGGP